MKIVHVVENLNRGGLERVVIDLVLAQRAAGDAPRVVCLFEPGSLAPELTAQGIDVIACRKGAGIDVSALRRLRRALAQDAGDAVVHTHNLLAHDYTALALIGLSNRRLINTRHGMGGNPVGQLRFAVYRLSMRWTHAVVAVCEAARRNLVARERIPSGKVVSVPNGIHVERFIPASTLAHARLAEDLGLPAATQLVGFVGRLNWAKDLPTMIRAFARVCRDRRDVALIVVGDGALRAELAALADSEGVAATIHFLGDRSDVRELLQGFDIFAMSSVSEGYSIALLEACATGLPIVATAVGGNAEIVVDGVNGRIVPPGDPAALAQALETMLADPDRRRAIGSRGRKWALEHATVARMLSGYAALYERPSKAWP
ncbi:MAG: glycosyltransferase [Dokdonella sp.]|uniref:glycosyltransferase n=1 Tax=Dokdonella sp. TaxID=2291710 RepID=UPI003264F187